MLIPDAWFWSGLGFMATAVGWLVRLEARFGRHLTRKEHSEICDKSNGELTRKLDRIEAILEKQNSVLDKQNEQSMEHRRWVGATLEKQNEQSVQHRQWVGDALGTIRTQVAVIRTKMKDDPLDDTGSFKGMGK